MNNYFLTAAAVVLCACGEAGAPSGLAPAPTAWVDPFIGVEIGNTLPGAMLPFGMVRLSPDVAPPNHTTGYRSDRPIRGFSHNHLSGTGGGARYGNVLVIPETGPCDLLPEPVRQDEYARPGYYSVLLKEHGKEIRCELTASERVGFHRYTFSEPAGRLTADELLRGYAAGVEIRGRVLIDVSAIIDMVEAESTHNVKSGVKILSDRELEGYGRFRGGWGGENPYTVYFAARFDRPFDACGTWKGADFTADSLREGVNIGAWSEFVLPQRGEVGLRVAISYVSTEQAWRNMESVADRDFDGVRNAADSIWNHVLGLLRVEGGTPELKTVFYTGLYHALMMPTDLGMDENPGWSSGQHHFWDFYTLWDTYRTVMPLYTLILPERQREIVRCLLDIYDHRGWLPDAWTAGDYAYVQGGSNADVVIADAVVKKLGGFDVAHAYEAVKKNADVVSDNPYKYGRDLYEYEKYGYLSNNVRNGSSKSLEYAYDDYCIAQVAGALGLEDDRERYATRSGSWLHLFDPGTRFFWAKDAEGNWMPGFSPVFRRPDYWNGPYFYEGTPWNYATYVPHDMQRLIAEHGGPERFKAFLDELFDGGHYEIGNEPGFLTPYLYHYAGRPDCSAERVRYLLNEFRTGRRGLPGQDDSGAMSAWFVFGSMGFFPVAGQDVYLIGTPLFTRSTLMLENGRRFTVIAPNTSRENKYVCGARLNGKKWDRCWFTHTDLARGGELVLEMGPIPSDWGTKLPPPSLSDILKSDVTE